MADPKDADSLDETLQRPAPLTSPPATPRPTRADDATLGETFVKSVNSGTRSPPTPPDEHTVNLSDSGSGTEPDDPLDRTDNIDASQDQTAVRDPDPYRTVAPAADGPRPTPRPAVHPTANLTGDDYEILGTLGRGGMGVVYQARHRKLNRLVAIKMILSGAHASPETLQRFQVEGRAVAKLQHPNIVQIFDIGERDGHPYFALEYLDGGSLQQKLDGSPQLPRQAAALVETLARAMHYAHQRGIVHRDLKPANVLLAADGTPKITDFGLAKQLDEIDAGQTGTEAILGTPTYMAPEQAAGQTKGVGPSADIYALGVMLYEMLTGRPPFRGATVMDTLQQVRDYEPVQPRRLQPTTPGDLQTICLKCLEKDPPKRYATAEALADDLRAFLDDRPIQARPVSAPERLVKWARRRPINAALAVVSVAAAIGLVVAGVYYVKKESQLRVQAETNVELARKATDEERQHREDAERDATEIRKQHDIAVENEKRALSNFRLAKMAADDVTQLAQSRLGDRPGLDKVRKEFLDQVVKIYEAFIESHTGAALVFERAQAYHSLGDAQQLLGDNDAAEQSYREAVKGCETKLAESANDATVRHELAVLHLRLWAVCLDRGKAESATASLALARRLLGELNDASPNQVGYLRELAASQNAEGIGYFRNADAAGNRLHALVCFERAADYLDRVGDEESQRPEFRLESAQTDSNLAVLYGNRSQIADDENLYCPQSAARLYAQAIGVLEPLQWDDRLGRVARMELARLYTNYGTFLVQNPDRGDGPALLGKANTLLVELNKQNPGVADVRYMLALNRSNSGAVLGGRKQYDAAEKDFATAVAGLRELADEFGDRPAFRLELARTLNRSAQVFVDQQPQRAAADLEAAEKVLVASLATDPQAPEFQQELLRTWVALLRYYDRQAHAMRTAERWPEATKAVARLVELHEKLQNTFPDQANNHGQLASTRLALARLQVKTNEPVAAAQTLTALAENRKDVPAGWGQFYSAAVLLARCAELADRDTNIPSPDREELRQRCTKFALLLLRQAVDRHEVFVVGPDDFKTLRDDANFKQLLAEIAAKAVK